MDQCDLIVALEFSRLESFEDLSHADHAKPAQLCGPEGPDRSGAIYWNALVKSPQYLLVVHCRHMLEIAVDQDDGSRNVNRSRYEVPLGGRRAIVKVDTEIGWAVTSERRSHEHRYFVSCVRHCHLGRRLSGGTLSSYIARRIA